MKRFSEQKLQEKPFVNRRWEQEKSLPKGIDSASKMSPEGDSLTLRPCPT